MDLNKLVEQTVWANGLLIEPVYSQPDREPRKLLSHIHLAETVWLERIAGEMLTTDVWRVLERSELEEVAAAHAETFRDLLKGDLQRVVAYRQFTGEDHRSPISEILLHLVTHAFHHRGQIATLLSGAGNAPPRTDFITFTRQ
jgi:uncharacterized damage-inducible protein DinB